MSIFFIFNEKNSKVPFDIDPEDLASLGMKENFEVFLKGRIQDQLEYGHKISPEEASLANKFGINISELTETIKPKEMLSETEIVKVKKQ